MHTLASRSLRLVAAMPFFAAALAAQSFEVPDFRGQPETAFAGWGPFTVAVGLPGNQPNVPTTTPFVSALLVQNNPTAFLTGGGGIYSFAEVVDFTLDFATDFVPGTVVLQTRSFGTLLDPASFAIGYFEAGNWTPLGGPIRTNLYSAPLGGAFGGIDSIDRWDWTLPRTLNATDLRIAFAAAGSSSSLTALRLDVAAIPEPSTYALLFGLAALAVAAWRTRHRS